MLINKSTSIFSNANNFYQSSILRKLDCATEHINISYDAIKNLNTEDKDFNTMRYYLKMSLILLERAGNAVQDSLSELEKKNLAAQLKVVSD